MIPEQRLREIAMASNGGSVVIDFDEVLAMAAELLAARAEAADHNAALFLIAGAIGNPTLCGSGDESLSMALAKEVVRQIDAARAENERLAKQRDELIGRAMKMREPLETMRVNNGAFGVGYDQVPDAICRLIGFAKSLVDAIAAEQPKPAEVCIKCKASSFADAKTLCMPCDGGSCPGDDLWHDQEQPKPAGGGA